MKRQTTLLILLSISILLLVIVGFWLTPRLVTALPGEVRGRLPSTFLRLVTTPLPTALPAPETAVSITSLLPTPTPTATAVPATNTQASQEITTILVTPPTSSSPTPLPPPTPTPLPPSFQLNGLTIAPQKLNNCGPTNLSIVLNYHGVETTQFDVANIVKPHYEDRNVSPEEMVDYVNQHSDLQAAVFRGGDLILLKQLLLAGFPVIIEKGYEPDEWQGWMGHYLTLYGFDEPNQSFVAMDTFLGPWDGSGRSVTYDETEQYWSQFNHTFLVVFPPSASDTIHDLLEKKYTVETTMWQNAVARSQQSLSQDPQQAFEWANLGMSLTRLAQINGDNQLYEQAALAYDQALLLGLPPRLLWYQFELYEAYLGNGRYDDVLTLTNTILENQGGRHVEETFYYRGQALQAVGNNEGARFAYNRALELKPGYEAARSSLNGLTQK